MATENIEAARKQFAWLAFLAAVVAAVGLLLPDVRDQLAEGNAAMFVTSAAALLFMAPIAAVIGGQLVLRILIVCTGMLLAGSALVLLIHEGPLTPAVVGWALSMLLLIGLALVRSPMRAWQAGTWK